MDTERKNIYHEKVFHYVQLAGSIMTLSGRLDITNHDLIGTDSGALQFTSFSQLMLQKGSEMHFRNNRGT